MEKKKKDGWDKADILFKPLGGLFTALAVAALGFFGSRFLENIKRNETRALQVMQSKESCARLYSELMSKREEAESSLRKDMFKSIIDSFLSPKSSTIETKVLNLELLVYNFHESLNLKPLFIHLKKEIGQIKKETGQKKQYLGRLDKVAREVTSKQRLVLGGAGETFSRTINLKGLKFFPVGADSSEQDFVQMDLTLDDIIRNFTIEALDADPNKKEIQVRLEVRRLNKSTKKVEEEVKAEFWIGFFDFPMIDNTRLSNDQRCAIVLDSWGESTADITLVYYPGAYASLKEKPYYLEVIQDLLKTSKLLGEGEKK